MRKEAGEARRWIRLRRRLGLDGNPLRRRSDRVEAALMAGLLAAFLVGAPLAVATGSHWAQVQGQRALRAQAAARQVPAVLLDNAPSDDTFAYQPTAVEWVRARWTAPDGAARVGTVPAASGTHAGTTVHVWVDAAGNVMSQRVTGGQVASRMVAAAVAAPLILAIGLLGVAAAARYLLDRRRLAAWEAAWTTTEPLWNQRL